MGALDRECEYVRCRLILENDLNFKATIFHAFLRPKWIGMHPCVAPFYSMRSVKKARLPCDWMPSWRTVIPPSPFHFDSARSVIEKVNCDKTDRVLRRTRMGADFDGVPIRGARAEVLPACAGLPRLSLARLRSGRRAPRMRGAEFLHHLSATNGWLADPQLAVSRLTSSVTVFLERPRLRPIRR